MSLISIDINPLLNAALGIIMWMRSTKALAHSTSLMWYRTTSLSEFLHFLSGTA